MRAKRRWIGIERNEEIDRVVEKERRRMQKVRGKEAFVGTAEAARALMMRGAKTKVKADA